ncbi:MULTISPECIES: hypothetical protein [Streptomyces]|uniref:hypothetical protein n=1 Tax=Streptomyces TaxID=1883 RepID=UPI00163CBC91|nr:MULTISPECIES: hypothetical protein [Streptomyces]MBC2879786.1 hypothetical protein [Streptomyces sp. TYQ1024]UBI41393.1 hypothetical protein K7I03_33545 [Streptomyces mobaraensis]
MTDPPQSPSTRPALTQREVVNSTDIPLTTLRRWRAQERFPNAYKDSSGTWRIPLGDLLDAGIRLHAPAPPDPGHQEATAEATAAGAPGHGGQDDDVAALRAETLRLEAELRIAEAERAQALAEARADHLERELAARDTHIGDLQRMLQALTPAPERAAIPQPAAPAHPPTTAPAAADSAPAVPPAGVPGKDAGGRRRRLGWGWGSRS